MKIIFEWDFENCFRLVDDEVSSSFVMSYSYSDYLNIELIDEIEIWAHSYSKYVSMNKSELDKHLIEFEKLDNEAKVLTQKISAIVFQRDNRITSVEYFSLCADVVLIRIEKSV
ncbi:MAG: hypothetical protein C0592_07550 [Marinilabiliales bacterium]|nr:MAG: hypothetical protein C0592_07550 [Marinilabiliales bacterium]